jgi:C1A family cysteine protease
VRKTFINNKKLKLISIFILLILIISILPHITARNVQINKTSNWISSKTSVSELSIEEKKLLLGAYHEDFSDVPEFLTNANAPDIYDWRDVNGKNWVTSIKNQKNCGSCVAFGTIAVVESVLQIESNNIYEPDLSEANLFFCGGGSCAMGWWPTDALIHLMSDGVADEDALIYKNPRNIECRDSSNDWRERKIKIFSFDSVNSANIKEALYTYGPLIATMDVYEDFYYYSGGVYEHNWGSRLGGHCVAIVGYNDIEDYWICKNSWGTNWGEDGFFKIRYDQCKIDYGAQYVTIRSSETPNKPTILNGAENGVAGQSLSYFVQADDPDNNGLYYYFDWGDGNFERSYRAYPSAEIANIDHIWSTIEEQNFEFRVKAIDVYGYEGDWSEAFEIKITNNKPNTPIPPTGLTDGIIEQIYNFETKSSDIDGHNIYYKWDWGDGSSSEWKGPYDSDTYARARHSWSSQGNYQIKVKAKDVHGAESDWSEPLTIIMPRNRNANNFFVYEFLQNFLNKFPNLASLFTKVSY